jgi:hypothetical protein
MAGASAETEHHYLVATLHQRLAQAALDHGSPSGAIAIDYQSTGVRQSTEPHKAHADYLAKLHSSR